MWLDWRVFRLICPMVKFWFLIQTFRTAFVVDTFCTRWKTELVWLDIFAVFCMLIERRVLLRGTRTAQWIYGKAEFCFVMPDFVYKFLHLLVYRYRKRWLISEFLFRKIKFVSFWTQWGRCNIFVCLFHILYCQLWIMILYIHPKIMSSFKEVTCSLRFVIHAFPKFVRPIFGWVERFIRA